MAVRRQCNRYRTTPHGTDRVEVLRRAKRFFRTGLNTDAFMIWGENGKTWEADYLPHNKDAKLPNMVLYRWNGTRWEQVENE